MFTSCGSLPLVRLAFWVGQSGCIDWGNQLPPLDVDTLSLITGGIQANNGEVDFFASGVLSNHRLIVRRQDPDGHLPREASAG